MASKSYPVISQKSYEEFPPNHPLRALAIIAEPELGDVLVCSLKGEARLPPAAGDSDVEGVCRKCQCAVVHRASAPDIPKECWRCFTQEGKDWNGTEG